MKDRIKLMLSGGISKEEYNLVRFEIIKENNKTLRWLLLILSALMIILIGATYNSSLHMISPNRLVYTILLILLLILSLISYKVIPKKPKYGLLVFYIFTIIFLIFSIYIGVVTNVDSRGSTINIFIIGLPLLLIDKPSRVSVLQIVSAISYCTVSYIYKDSALFFSDTVNCLCVLAVSIGINIFEQNIRFRGFKDHYIIEQEHIYQLRQKDVEVEENRIAIMLSQIQPHFLYNALLAIQELCHLDPQQAEQATIEFSKFLRGNMDSLKEDKPIPFQKEIEHTKYYLALEKRRFGNKLNIEFDLQGTNFFIPALTLQPIVENAVRYGVTKKPGGGTIRISSYETEDCFGIEVQDDGKGFDILKTKDDGRTHIGITNVQSRLLSMCNGSLQIDSKEDAGTKAVILIPKGGK